MPVFASAWPMLDGEPHSPAHDIPRCLLHICKPGMNAIGILLRLAKALSATMVIGTTTDATIGQLGVGAWANALMRACAATICRTRHLRRCLTLPFGLTPSLGVPCALLGRLSLPFILSMLSPPCCFPLWLNATAVASGLSRQDLGLLSTPMFLRFGLMGVARSLAC